jgi:VPDSG-CTERM motif
MLAIGFISCSLFSEQAQATSITGDIGFSGATTFNTTSLTTATRINSWFAFVGTTSESFVGVPIGSSVTLAASWIFNPSTPTPGLWSVGGFSFDLDTATIETQNSHLLSITGTGTLTGAGFDPTPGTWAFSAQSAGGIHQASFTFSADNTAGVPDGGMTVALLGIAFVGLEGLRRKLHASRL